MKDSIEPAHAVRRAGSAKTVAILLGVTLSISTAACSMFDSTPVQEKVVQHAVAKDRTEPYVIGSDDDLEIIVWTQPQLSGRVIVASDGTIAMPLIGRVPASGQTPDQLKAELEKRDGVIQNLSARVKDLEPLFGQNGSGAQRPGGSDTERRLIAKVNQLQQELATEKQKNRALKGG